MRVYGKYECFVMQMLYACVLCALVLNAAFCMTFSLLMLMLLFSFRDLWKEWGDYNFQMFSQCNVNADRECKRQPYGRGSNHPYTKAWQEHLPRNFLPTNLVNLPIRKSPGISAFSNNQQISPLCSRPTRFQT